jgi:hypothetical protein
MSAAPAPTAVPSGRLAVLRVRDFRRVFLAQAFGVTALCWASAGLGLVASVWVLFVKDVWRLRPATALAAAPAAPSPPPAAPPRD